ncbi:hypothetical protein H5410_059284 [Solanum commersonii]|uniref:Uncharacterized protein n=1 Tax=Solanum commersonii TaxID=4109 RepID=A0A9J5W2Z3_SOLCO|nr:hypothetical protein H5410_059284 [Solanum commersonii]
MTVVLSIIDTLIVHERHLTHKLYILAPFQVQYTQKKESKSDNRKPVILLRDSASTGTQITLYNSNDSFDRGKKDNKVLVCDRGRLNMRQVATIVIFGVSRKTLPDETREDSEELKESISDFSSSLPLNCNNAKYSVHIDSVREKILAYFTELVHQILQVSFTIEFDNMKVIKHDIRSPISIEVGRGRGVTVKLSPCDV